MTRVILEACMAALFLGSALVALVFFFAIMGV